MCDSFLPEVERCCLLCSYRIGLMFISVLAIVTGSMTLSLLELASGALYTSYIDNIMNVTDVKRPEDVVSQMNQLIQTGIAGISLMFMLMGLILLVATLIGQECLVQLFVWGTFLTAIFGFFLVIAICFECLIQEVCLLSSLDWLSGSGLLVLLIGYMFLWIYFTAVANSYIINGD